MRRPCLGPLPLLWLLLGGLGARADVYMIVRVARGLRVDGNTVS